MARRAGRRPYFGLYLTTLYKLIDQGEVPAYQIGRVIRLRRADLDAFLECSRVKPRDLAHLNPPEHEDRKGGPTNGGTLRLLGAVVGAVGSVLGAVIVNRNELKRSARSGCTAS